MSLKRIQDLLFIFLFSVPIFVQAQETVRVELNERTTDEQFRKTQAIIPVFKYKGQPFEGVSDFGLKTSKKHKPETFQIKFPDMTGMKDTSYTFFFFGANETHTPIGYVFCIVGNNNRMRGNTYLWIDRNMNLDLSDDGAPDSFSNLSNYIHKIKLSHSQFPNAYHEIQISRFDFDKNIQYKKLLDDHYRKNSGSKEFEGADFSFREQRMIIHSADYKHGLDSFKIAIKDFNCNGLYNDKKFDQILVGEYNTQELGNNIYDIDAKDISFEWNRKRYRITHIDPAGQYIEFYYDAQWQPDRQLKYGKKIPKFKVEYADNQKKSKKIRRFRRKPVYIVFWNFESRTFVEDTANLAAIQREFGDKIHIITLNYGEPPRKVLGWAHKNGVEYTVGIANKKLLDLYYVETLPTSFLTNKRQRLSEINITSRELLDRLRKQYNK